MSIENDTPAYRCTGCGHTTEDLNSLMNHCNDCEGGEPTQVEDAPTAKDELPQLSVAWIGDGKYAVWSNNDGQSVYEVHLGRRECSCKGDGFSSGNDACYHLGAVIERLPAAPSGHEIHRQNLKDAQRDVREAVDTLNDFRRAADDKLPVADTDGSQSASETVNATQPDNDPDPDLPDKTDVQAALLDAGIDVGSVEIEFDGADIRLDGDPENSAWDNWSNEHFGEDNPGYIDWSEVDGQYVPEAFVVPKDARKEVLGL